MAGVPLIIAHPMQVASPWMSRRRDRPWRRMRPEYLWRGAEVHDLNDRYHAVSAVSFEIVSG